MFAQDFSKWKDKNHPRGGTVTVPGCTDASMCSYSPDQSPGDAGSTAWTIESSQLTTGSQSPLLRAESHTNDIIIKTTQKQ